MTATICLGDVLDIYDLAEVQLAREKADALNGAGLLRVYDQMLGAGQSRFVSKPSNSQALDPVLEACPNFAGVIEDLQGYIELAAAGSGGLNIMPVLLCGDPGVGKTHFAKVLAQALGVPYQFVSMGTMSAGWILSGSAPTWNGARHGKIAETLIDNDFANPVFLLDELDKTGGDTRYDPHGALLQLLEKETSRHFKDEFLDVELNASNIFWVATANDVNSIPSWILSRMAVYEVPSPTPVQAAVIAKNIYAGLLKANNWPFSPALSQAVLDCMAQIPPREMKKKLLDGMAKAIKSRRAELAPEDVHSSHSQRARPIGFL